MSKPLAVLYLTRRGTKNKEGLELLDLNILSTNKSSSLACVSAVSGQPWAQEFLNNNIRQPGSFTPLPEGVYTIGPLEWASGKVGDFSGSFGSGLGPIWSLITPGFKIYNSKGLVVKSYRNACMSFDFGLHADWNEDTSPGTAGCVGIQGESGPRDLERLKTISHWFMSYDIRALVVNYGLGSTNGDTLFEILYTMKQFEEAK